MADSAEQKPEGSAEEKSLVPQEITIRNPDGTYGTRLKDPTSGKFLKKHRGMPSSREMTKLGRKILTKRLKIDEHNYTSVFEAMTQHMTDIARGVAEGDPKAHMASVQAYKIVLERLIGKIPPSDEELEAQQSNGVRVIIIQPPKLMNDQLKENPPEPKFLPAEIVEDKKKEDKK
jgi:hypothetical protein